MNEVPVTLHFPLAGVDVSTAYDRQRIGNPATGVYGYSTPAAVNVRAVEPATNRARGGSRPGLTKYIETRPGLTKWVVQCLDVIVTTSAGAQS